MIPAFTAYLTAEEVAERLRVSPRRVRLIPANELPYLQLEHGGVRKYDPRDVAAYVKRRTVRE